MCPSFFFKWHLEDNVGLLITQLVGWFLGLKTNTHFVSRDNDCTKTWLKQTAMCHFYPRCNITIRHRPQKELHKTINAFSVWFSFFIFHFLEFAYLYLCYSFSYFYSNET